MLVEFSSRMHYKSCRKIYITIYLHIITNHALEEEFILYKVAANVSRAADVYEVACALSNMNTITPEQDLFKSSTEVFLWNQIPIKV